MTPKKTLYRSMCDGYKSYHGEKTWKPGKWYKVRGKLDMCNNGFHASEKVIDAMSYVPMGILAKVEVRGKSIKQQDKQCWSEMKIVKAWKWTKKDSVALSVYSASPVLKNFEDLFPDDKRPRQAIEAAERWLKNPTKKNASAARSAARSTESAAWSAARSAARSAAWSAARSETIEKIESWIKRRVKKLEVIYE